MPRGRLGPRFSLALAVLLSTGGCDGEGDGEGPCEGLTDRCERAGATRCATVSAVQTCQPNEEGCLIWTHSAACGGRQSCEPGADGAACQCAHLCTEEGPRACDGDAILGCVPDDDGCLYYSLTEDCSDSGLVCDDSSGAPVCVEFCVDRCEALGPIECAGDYLMTCIVGSMGCRVIQVIDCAEDGEVCDDTSGTPRCVAP